LDAPHHNVLPVVIRARLLAAGVPGMRRLDIVSFQPLALSMIDPPRCRERRWCGEQVVNKQTPSIAPRTPLPFARPATI
jgi:hypothetical protein